MMTSLDFWERATTLTLIFMLFIGLSTHIQTPRAGRNLGKRDEIYPDRYENSSVIRINNNSELEIYADEEGWEGNGSEQDPYVIEDYDIDARGGDNAIFIGNVSLHFIIRDCHLFNSTSQAGLYPKGAGISLYKVYNASLISNNLTNNNRGMRIDSSSSVEIIDNKMTDGILVEDSEMMTLKGNLVEGRTGIVLKDSNENHLYDNRLIDSDLSLEGQKSVFTSQEITVNNTINGKPIYYYKNRDMENLAVPADAGSVITGNVTGLTIEDLELERGKISIGYSSNISIINNLCSQGGKGVSLYSSENISIKGNSFRKNHIGIYMSESEYNRVYDNHFDEDHKSGIYLEGGADNNKIDNNTLERCGIDLYDAEKNLLIYNLICKNSDFGVAARSGCTDNRIYLNSFLHNSGSDKTYNSSHIQAKDESGHDIWNSSEGVGNYWLDWTSPDADGDGIVDSSYELEGSDSYDHHPLVEPPIPVIPSKPLNLSIETGFSSLNLSWEHPKDDGGSNILGYEIYRGNQTEEYKSYVKVDAGRDSFTDTGVKNGVEYTYKIAAYNRVGESILTEEVKGVPDGLAPTLNVLNPRNNSFLNTRSLTVAWNGSDTNSGISHYEIKIDGGNWSSLGLNDSYPLVNLTDGNHSVDVKAVDNAGNMKVVRREFVIDMTSPEVISRSPKGRFVPVDFKIVLNFSEPMDPGSMEINISNKGSFEIEWITNQSVIAVPDEEPYYGTAYEVSVNGTDRAGNQLEEVQWTFQITTNGTVTGRIVDKDEKPVAGVRVTLDNGVEAVTDKDGRFALESPAGEYRITLSKDGYKDRSETVKIEPGEEAALEEKVLRPKSSRYDWLLIVFSLIIVVSGIIAFAVFMLREEEEEFEEEEIEEEEEVEEVPPEFLE